MDLSENGPETSHRPSKLAFLHVVPCSLDFFRKARGRGVDNGREKKEFCNGFVRKKFVALVEDKEGNLLGTLPGGRKPQEVIDVTGQQPKSRDDEMQICLRCGRRDLLHKVLKTSEVDTSGMQRYRCKNCSYCDQFCRVDIPGNNECEDCGCDAALHQASRSDPIPKPPVLRRADSKGSPEPSTLGYGDLDFRVTSSAPNAKFLCGQWYEVIGTIMRQEEAMDSPKITRLAPDTKVQVLEVGTGPTGKRIKVRAVPSRLEGWISVVSQEGVELLRGCHESAATVAPEQQSFSSTTPDFLAAELASLGIKTPGPRQLPARPVAARRSNRPAEARRAVPAIESAAAAATPVATSCDLMARIALAEDDSAESVKQQGEPEDEAPEEGTIADTISSLFDALLAEEPATQSATASKASKARSPAFGRFSQEMPEASDLRDASVSSRSSPVKRHISSASAARASPSETQRIALEPEDDKVESLEDILAKLKDDGTSEGIADAGQDTASSSANPHAQLETKVERRENIASKLSEDSLTIQEAAQHVADAVDSRGTQPEIHVERLEDILAKIDNSAGAGDGLGAAGFLKQDTTDASEIHDRQPEVQVERLEDLTAKLNQDADSEDVLIAAHEAGEATAYLVESRESRPEVQVDRLEDIVAKLSEGVAAKDVAAEAWNSRQDASDVSDSRERASELQVERLEDILAKIDQESDSGDTTTHAHEVKKDMASASESLKAQTEVQVEKLEDMLAKLNDDAFSARIPEEAQDVGESRTDAAQGRETQPETQVQRLEDTLARLNKDAPSGDAASERHDATQHAADVSEVTDTHQEIQVERLRDTVAKFKRDAGSEDASTAADDAWKDRVDVVESQETQKDNQMERLEDALPKLNVAAASEDTAAESLYSGKGAADPVHSRDTQPEFRVEALEDILAKLNEDAVSEEAAADAQEARETVADASEIPDAQSDIQIDSLEDILARLDQHATSENAAAEGRNARQDASDVSEIPDIQRDIRAERIGATMAKRNHGAKSEDAEKELQAEQSANIMAKLDEDTASGDIAAEALDVGEDTADTPDSRDIRPDTEEERLGESLAKIYGRLYGVEFPVEQAQGAREDTTANNRKIQPGADTDTAQVERLEDTLAPLNEAKVHAATGVQEAAEVAIDLGKLQEFRSEARVGRFEEKLQKMQQLHKTQPLQKSGSAAPEVGATDAHDTRQDVEDGAEMQKAQPQSQVERFQATFRFGEARAAASKIPVTEKASRVERLEDSITKLNEDASSGDTSVVVLDAGKNGADVAESQEAQPEMHVERLEDILAKLDEALELGVEEPKAAEEPKAQASPSSADNNVLVHVETEAASESGTLAVDSYALEPQDDVDNFQVESMEEILAKLNEEDAAGDEVAADVAPLTRETAAEHAGSAADPTVVDRANRTDVAASGGKLRDDSKRSDSFIFSLENEHEMLSAEGFVNQMDLEDSYNVDWAMEITPSHAHDAGRNQAALPSTVQMSPDAKAMPQPSSQKKKEDADSDIEVERLEDILARLDQGDSSTVEAPEAQAGNSTDALQEQMDAPSVSSPEPAVSRPSGTQEGQPCHQISATEIWDSSEADTKQPLGASFQQVPKASSVVAKTDVNEPGQHGLPKRISNFQFPQRRAASKVLEASVSKPVRVSSFQRSSLSTSIQKVAQEDTSEVSRLRAPVVASEKDSKDLGPEPSGLGVHEDGASPRSAVEEEVPSKPMRPARKSAFSRYLQK